MSRTEPLLQVEHLKVYYPVKGGIISHTTGYIHAVDDVSFSIDAGTTLGLVGESGCGKSTIGRQVVRLETPTNGSIRFDGLELTRARPRQLAQVRTQLQMVFQDNYSSLNPKKHVFQILSDPMVYHGLISRREAEAEVDRLLDLVGMPKRAKNRYPHEFSGGQRQRICIARALALNPEFVVCDEPVSALDVSIQAQIINLLKKLQQERNLTYLFISHDLSVVEHISDTVGVMYLGNLVEYGATADIFKHPLHPYTEALFSAIPIPDPKAKMNRIVLEGTIPSPANPPSGCKFHTRCAHCTQRCKEEAPRQIEVEPGHYVVCHLFDQ